MSIYLGFKNNNSVKYNYSGLVIQVYKNFKFGCTFVVDSKNSQFWEYKGTREQCDHIGLFLKCLCVKFPSKSGPYIWWLLELFVKTLRITYKTDVPCYFLGNFWQNWVSFNSNIWSHCSGAKQNWCVYAGHESYDEIWVAKQRKLFSRKYFSRIEWIDGWTRDNSVTRFGEIPPLWHIFKNLWQYI